MIGRTLNRRLDRLAARILPSSTQPECEIQFVSAQTGAVESTLFLGDGRREWRDNGGSERKRSALGTGGPP